VRQPVKQMLDYQAIVWGALAAVIAWTVMTLGGRWWSRWSAGRHRRRATKHAPAPQPESRYVVRLSESGASCARPDGVTESVAWDDLRQVEIVTTDRGPLHPDVFWVLHGSKTGCAVPQGATGEPELLERLQRLPGFRNDVVIQAMGSAENRRFVCWQKPGAAADRPG
jgi:hypothetical protein